jgi:RNA polymerase sigma factor for flagellar operon FliA
METPDSKRMMTNSEFAVHMPLVTGIVAEFMRRVPKSVQREDLIAAGSMGLLHALRSDKHTCPEMLTAYARIRIRGAIIDELRRHDWSPRRRRIIAQEALEEALAAGEEVSEVPTMKQAGVVVVGLDDVPPAESMREDGPSPLEELELERSKNDIRAAIEKLPPRERIIVRMRFFDDITSKSIAVRLGLSEARVSQLLTRATLLLKQVLRGEPIDVTMAA